MYSKPALIGLVLAGILGFVTPSNADFPVPPDTKGAALCVLPPTAYATDSRAIDTVLPLIYQELESRGTNFVTVDQIRPDLRRLRIRSRGLLSEREMRTISNTTGVSYLLVSTVDVFEEGSNPEFGISLRLLSAANMRIVRASSDAATGADFIGLFGLGGIDAIDSLAAVIVPRAFEGLDRPVPIEWPATFWHPRPRVAIVTFDNLSESRRAGEAVTNLLISRLVVDGYEVIEPGLLNEIYLRNHLIPRGEIGYDLLDQVYEKYSPDWILTGVVSTFDRGAGTLSQASPEIEVDARVLRAETGKILWTWSSERSGRGEASLLGLGRVYSLPQLTTATLDKMVRKLNKQRKDESR